MNDELMDICDGNNDVVGQGMKSEILRRGLWHRTARLYPYNSKSEILMQLRGKDKELYPDRWDVGAAGHVGAGEAYADAAIREAKEELGKFFEKDELELLVIDKCEGGYGEFIEKVFAATYLVRFEGRLDEFVLQKEEVQKLEFVSVADLEKDLKQFPDKFSPHPDEYWERLIESVKKRVGCVK
ncbi:MAG: NUDIX domain-containing protein [Candidatus Pacebacteria bacterium]|jgi:isopentenyldiphosphate isomerase|nr:NUDIX domain-containing protein [Candidatus Paceibacterota bacterium]